MVTEIVVVIVASIFEGGKTPVREYDVFKNEMLNNGTSLASCASFTDELNIDIEDEWFLQEDYENVENEIWFVLHNIPAGVYTLVQSMIQNKIGLRRYQFLRQQIVRQIRW